MRIAILIEAWKPVWAGGQVHVWELCKNLINNYDCEIDLFVMNLKGNDEKEVYPQQEEHFSSKLRIFRIGKPCSQILIPRIKWTKEVVRVIQQKHSEKPYDLIHAHANIPGFPGKILSTKLNLPIIYTVHGSGIQSIKDMYGENIKSYIFAKTEQYVQTRIKYDAQITVDSSFLKYKNINQNIHVIPNGVNLEKFDQIKIKKSKKFKIIFVGRLHPQKGLTYLLDAVSLIKDKKEMKNVEINLIGSGELEEVLKQKSKVLGLDHIFKFRGKIYGKETIEEFKSSHLFILPSLYEGQPLTLLEAWAAKLPVLVTDVGGNKDFVVNEENGYLIPAKDINILADTLLKAINNKTLNKMGERGYKLVKENYSWDKMTEKTYRVYEKLIKKIS